MLEELQKVVGELYELYGATTQVVKLSQILDELIVIAFDNLTMLFRSKRVFVIRYLFVRNRLGNVTLIKNEDEEEDKEC